MAEKYLIVGCFIIDQILCVVSASPTYSASPLVGVPIQDPGHGQADGNLHMFVYIV